MWVDPSGSNHLSNASPLNTFYRGVSFTMSVGGDTGMIAVAVIIDLIAVRPLMVSTKNCAHTLIRYPNPINSVMMAQLT